MNKFLFTNYVRILSLLIGLSFCFHVYFAKEHFQEIDSDVVFYALKHFDDFAYKYTNYSYLKKPELDFHKKYRQALISIVSGYDLPDWAKGIFVIPYSTTYFPGMGLVYGLIYSYEKNYDDFMFVGILILQILFHLSVMLLFFTLLKMTNDEKAAFLASLVYLFSVSHYSYASNLGSPMWTVVTSIGWMSILAFSKNENKDRNVSLSTACCIFFNYLILIYWLGYILYRIIDQKSIFKIFKTQLLAIFFIFVCTLLFVQPGQGFRGVSVFIFEMHEEFLYMMANFSAFFTSERLLNLQIILIFIPFLFFLYRAIKTKFYGISSYLKIAFSISAVFMAFVAFDFLVFLASRHMLFLSAVFFVILSFGFASLLNYFSENRRNKIFLSLSAVLIAVAPFALWGRKEETKDKLKVLSTSNIENLILLDSRLEFPHNSQPTLISVPAFDIGISTIYELKFNTRYYFLSQLTPLSGFVMHSKDVRNNSKLSINSNLNRDVKIHKDERFCDEVSFMAYERFRYGFQKMNCRYFTEFEVVDNKANEPISSTGDSN
ncbi:MAG: hypothetical protein AABY64_14830 [Bdellovibrionota bacterium]